MTAERELEQELEKLKDEAPDPAERWVRALVTSLDGSQTGVQNSKGVLRAYEDAETYELPEEWLHVASGPGELARSSLERGTCMLIRRFMTFPRGLR